MRELGKTFTTSIRLYVYCTFTVARTLLPFDEYLQSLNIIHPEKRPQEYDKVNTYCIEGDQPEKSLTRKDELQKNPQEYGIQQGNGSRDESNQKDGSLAKGESIVKGRKNHSSNDLLSRINNETVEFYKKRIHSIQSKLEAHSKQSFKPYLHLDGDCAKLRYAILRAFRTFKDNSKIS